MPIIREKTEAEWRAEDDARTLAQAEEIKADNVRLEKAKQAAKKLSDEEEERARAMKKVAGQKVKKDVEVKQAGTFGVSKVPKNIFGEINKS